MPTHLNTERPPPRHIALKLSKVNDQKRILKAASEKRQQPTRETPPKVIVWIFGGNPTRLERMEWYIPNIEREKPAKLPLRYGNKLKAFSDTQKLWECIVPALHWRKCWKELLHLQQTDKIYKTVSKMAVGSRKSQLLSQNRVSNTKL